MQFGYVSMGAALSLVVSGCNVMGSTQISQNFAPGVEVSDSLSAVSVSSAEVTIGQSITVTASLRDTNGNAYVSTLPSVSFQTSGGSSTGTFSRVVNNGDGSYSASFTGVNPGTATSIQAIVNGNSLTSTAPSVTVIQTYSLANSILSLSGASESSGTAVIATLTVKDSTGAQLTTGGLNVAFSNSGGSSTGSWSSVTDHGDGTYSATFTGIHAGTATTIGASIQGEAITSSLPTETVTAASVSNVALALTGAPSITADGASTTTLQATATDLNGNPVSGANVSLSIPTNGGTTTSPATTDGLGVASFTLTASTIASSYNYTATSNGHTSSATTVTFTAGATVASIVWGTAPSLAYAASNSAPMTTFTAKLEDAYGNVITSDSATTVTASVISGSGVLGGTTTVTASNGVATFSAVTDTTASTITIQAKENTANHTVSRSSVVVAPATTIGSLVWGTAPNLAYSASNSAPMTTFTARLLDPYGNLITSNSSTTVTASIASGSGSLGGTTTVTASGGIATFSAVTDTTASTITIQAKENTSSKTISQSSVVVNPSSTIASIVWGTAPSLTYTASNSNPMTAFTAVLKDSNGNVITTNSSTTVTASITSGSGTLGGTTTVTASSGVATFNAITDTTASTVTIQAKENTSNKTVTQSSIVVSPAAFSLSQSQVSSPASVTSGSAVTVTLTAKDAYGNSNPSGITGVTFTSTSVGGTGTYGSVTNTGNGVYTASFTGVTSGSCTLGATINSSPVTSASSPASITISPSSTIASLAWGTAPASYTASNSTPMTSFTARLEDANGNVITSNSTTTVTASITSGSGTLGGTTTVTASNGVATFSNLTDTTASTITLQAKENTANNTVSQSVVVSPAAFSLSQSLVSSPSQVTTGSGVTVTLTAKDAYGNSNPSGISSVAFTSSTSPGSGTFGSISSSSGVYTATFTGANLGSVTLGATINSSAVTSTPSPSTISVVAVAPSSLTYSLNTAVYTKGTAITSNTPASSGGAVVSYSVTPSLPAGLSLDTSTGAITGTPTAITAQANYTVTATNSGGSTTDPVSITVNDVPPSGLSYPTPTATYAVNALITSQSPTVSGGTVVSYSVSPSLPAGLTLNTTTGVLSGTPTTTAGTTNYTVTATNTGGSATATLTLTVTTDTTPPTLSSLSVNGSTLGGSTTNNFVTMALSSSDNLTNISKICFKSNTTAAPSAADSCWESVGSLGSTPANPLSLSASYQMATNGSYGTYSIYAYTQDAAGNISQLTNSGAGTVGVDTVSITYSGGAAPVLASVEGSATATPSNPPTSSDLSITSGGNVYIQWKLGAVANSPATLALYYSTDGVNYTAITSGLSDGANGCTPDSNHSGCYLWSGGSPTSNYFAVRAIVTDGIGQATASSSPAINSGSVTIIAGNTDPGTNGSASTATFTNYVTPSRPDVGSLAVAQDGTIYFRDLYRGIVTVSPSNNIQKILLPLNAANGSGYGDGGPATSASVYAPYKITLDSSGNLLIWDYDRIRVVNTTGSSETIAGVTIPAGDINTIIGGGTSTADGVAPNTVKISALGTTLGADTSYFYTSFFALPSGDIYFQSGYYNNSPNAGERIRVYSNSSGLVGSIYFTGTGDSMYSSDNIANLGLFSFGVTYDPNTSEITGGQISDFTGDSNNTHAQVSFNIGTWSNNQSTWTSAPNSVTNPITGTGYPSDPLGQTGTNGQWSPIQGRNGNLYMASNSTLYEYSTATNVWSRILGGGSTPFCPDGTSALSCSIVLEDASITANGTVYFVDGGLIRSITSSGTVITVAGQRLSSGDGGSALAARFDVINSLDVLNSGAIDVLDSFGAEIRQFTVGGNVSDIAGDQTVGGHCPYSTTASPTSIGLYYSTIFDDFKADPSTGDIYFYSGPTGASVYLEKLSSSTGLWQTLAGGGSTIYYNADGLSSSSISFTTGMMRWGDPRVIGWDGTNVLVDVEANSVSSINEENAMLKTYNGSSGLQSNIAGLDNNSGNASNFPSSTTAASSLDIPEQWAAVILSRSSYDSYPTNPRWVNLVQGTTLVEAIDVIASGYENTGNAYNLATLSVAANSFTYIHDASNNIIYYCGTDGKLHKHDINASTDTAYAWPVSSIQCTGRTLVYSSTLNALVFPFTQNGLYGVAEYVNP